VDPKPLLLTFCNLFGLIKLQTKNGTAKSIRHSSLQLASYMPNGFSTVTARLSTCGPGRARGKQRFVAGG
jgi:hypothetical protein